MLIATAGAMASTAYYTIFHALESETMNVFAAGGQGTLSVSRDGGESFARISNIRFDRYGRGVARVYELNRVPGDTPAKLTASFNEGENGKPLDTVIETTAGALLDSLSPYRQWPWLSYSPLYVTYESLPNIVEIAVADGRFETLVAAITKAGLTETLSGEGTFTVFAPTDKAFADLLSELGITAEQLLENPDLGDILLYHVIGAALDGNEVTAETHLETLLGKTVDVSRDGDNLFINDSKVIIANIEASNGIIHVIDRVLLPLTLPNIVEIAVNDGRFETLVAALVETGLDGALAGAGPFTVFVPTDDAFSLLLGELGVSAAELLANPDLANILLYHVVDGRLDSKGVAALERLNTLLGKELKINVTEEGVFINNSKVIIENIKAENGIIHVIDAVLVPQEMPDIVEVAVAAGNFETLVGALQATGLDATLQDDGPFTVFAPTDAAFAKLPSWLVNFLVNNPKYLEQVLLYHVVAGDLNASEVKAQRRLETLTGRNITVRTYDEKVYMNNAKVSAADIEARNGTIHVIDRVLIPWFSH